ncbi:hypothetical protein [Streptomyces sp. NPDC005009]
MRVAVDAVERNWRRPDAGLWEPEDRWWTHSRLGVACGLRHIADVFPDPAARRRTTLWSTPRANGWGPPRAACGRRTRGYVPYAPVSGPARVWEGCSPRSAG